ncbi:MAG: hypothetical protein AB1640_11550 [bacterium]
MRWVPLFLLIAAAVTGFIVFDHFPGLLEDYPRLRQINNRVRDLMGLEFRGPDLLSERELKKAGEVFPDETGAEDLLNACGEPPANPWSGQTPPGRTDLDRYSLAMEVWKYCVQKQKKQIPLFGPQDQGHASRGVLPTYDER